MDPFPKKISHCINAYCIYRYTHGQYILNCCAIFFLHIASSYISREDVHNNLEAARQPHKVPRHGHMRMGMTRQLEELMCVCVHNIGM
jgi:hypothetical protein